jgi:hypothetical protein
MYFLKSGKSEFSKKKYSFLSVCYISYFWELKENHRAKCENWLSLKWSLYILWLPSVLSFSLCLCLYLFLSPNLLLLFSGSPVWLCLFLAAYMWSIWKWERLIHKTENNFLIWSALNKTALLGLCGVSYVPWFKETKNRKIINISCL